MIKLTDDLLAAADSAPRHRTRDGLLLESIRAAPPGLCLEFGVYTGGTLRCAAGAFPERKFVGFDWFRGLPEHWNKLNPKGHYDAGGSPPRDMPANVTIVDGLFADTVGPFMAACDMDVGFAHLDCDLYSSTRDALAGIDGRTVPGAIFLFDEFGGYAEEREHEARAFAEWLSRTGWKWECLGRFDGGWHSASFRVNP